MYFPPFNFEKSRFERKFAVKDMYYHEIVQQIRNNRAAFLSIYHPRYINNIYFDTNDMDFYSDNVSGKGSRKKVRIRWYGNLMGNISHPVLEFKMREGMVGNKLSFPLKSFSLDESFTGDYIQDILRLSELPDWVNSVMLMIKPALLNCYHRQYFISFNNNFRVTLDNKLSYFSIGNGVNNFIKKHTNDDVIVELKYDNQHDGKDAAYVTNDLPFRLTKSSKYVNGFEMLHPMVT
ncbi:MAG TPA: VTC domain-containing protein [Bacteroidales bacterium]|jgi:SPX domain protein involved in polyphosphate accumulation|nr:VTC domain-containing protein [Bacteroidales bacterium]|tara:strand:- start:241 stop:945 length:705 start_codon:yes stop_codon:yes gene_type:complete